MALIKEYFTLTDKYTAEYGAKTVVLLQVGAFFEVYGQIITTASGMDIGGGGGGGAVMCSGSRIDDFCSICELAKANKTAGFVMAGFRDYGLDKYLKKLQDAGYTAVVYVQDGIKNPPVRSLQGIYSPGTYFSTDVAGGGSGGGGGGGMATRLSSVLSLLNHTVTPMGSRAYKYTLLHPVFDEARLEQDYAITEYMLSLTAGGIDGLSYTVFREKLAFMKDIE